MKKYLKPQIEIIEAECASILAGSDIPVSTTPTDPSNALAPSFGGIKFGDFNIFGEETEQVEENL